MAERDRIADLAPFVARGERVTFVHWINTADGWIPELVSGLYAGFDDGLWRVLVGDEPRYLPRSEWAVCAA